MKIGHKFARRTENKKEKTMEKNENGYSEYRLGGMGNGCNNGQTQRQNGNRQDGCGSPNRERDTGRQNGDRADWLGSQDGASEYRYENGDMRQGCGCNGESRHLAMVYSPYQCWRMLYTPSDALKHGTLFEELYKPVGECNKNG